MLIGNLTRDPELSTTTTGLSVCKFGIAVNDRFVAENPKVNFFNIITWRGLADNCSKYLQKGNKVAVSGRIDIREYEAKDGTKKMSVDVVADDIEFLTPKGQSGMESGYNEPTAPYNPTPLSKKPVAQLTPVEDDGLPF